MRMNKETHFMTINFLVRHKRSITKKIFFDLRKKKKKKFPAAHTHNYKYYIQLVQVLQQALVYIFKQ